MLNVRLKFEKLRSNITWVMPVFHSLNEVKIHLPVLRATYPTSEIKLINDGDSKLEDYASLAKIFKARVEGGQHLFELKHADKFIIRLLKGEAHVANFVGSAAIIRIDPDAVTHRRLTLMPSFSCVFGTLEGRSAFFDDDIIGAPNVQGGCLGVTSDVAREMVNFLEKNGNVFLNGHWARCRDAKQMLKIGKFSDDFAITWLASELGVPIVSHPEIRSNWTTVPDNQRNEFAITHPRVQKNYSYLHAHHRNTSSSNNS